MRAPRAVDRRAAARWVAVAAGVVVLILLPTAVRLVPRAPDSVSADALLHQIQGSGGIGYSGYAESVGTLALPVTSGVTNLADLLGSRTSMRVWWRSATDWRVDQIAPFGEVDTHRDATGTVSWDYERNRVQRTDDLDDIDARAVRIPVAGDLLPPELGRRLLSQAGEQEVTRLAVRRIAGVDAPGVRLSTPAQSSIDHVDVYAAPNTGLPLAVEVYGRDDPHRSTVSTSFLDLTVAMPAAATTAFQPPPGAAESDGLRFDPLSAAQRFGFARAPDTLAGLTRNTLGHNAAGGNDLGSADLGGDDAVGVYGHGVTELVAVPLGRRTTGQFSDQLTTAGSSVTPACSDKVVCGGRRGTRQEASVGPLSVLLLRLPPDQDGDSRGWALTGTVLPATLRTAADALLAAAA